MKNTKLIRLLKSFDKNEFTDLRSFVKSPFFNKRHKVTELLEALCKYYPSFKVSEIPKEKIFAAVYRNAKYSDELMRNLISHLYKLAEEYLEQKGFRDDFINRKRYLLKELTQRDQFKLFEKNLKITNDYLSRNKILDSEYFLKHYFIELEVIHFLNRSKSAPFLVNDNAQKIADNLLHFFLIAMMGINSYMINQSKNAFDYDFKMSFLSKILEHIEEKGYEHMPHILMHYNSIKLLMTGEERYFYGLRNVLFNQRNEFGAVDIYNIYVFLNSYCYRRYTAGDIEFARLGLELYKNMFENNAHATQGYAHHILFKNVVTCALSVNKTAWTEYFIEKYKDELQAEHRESSYNLCNAFLKFHLGNYRGALTCLSKITMEDITYKIDAKALTAKIYYCTNAHESLLSHFDSYRHFLKTNHMIPARLKETHLGFVNYMSRFVNLKDKNDEAALEVLSAEISKAPYFVHKFWLHDEVKKHACNNAA